MADQLTGMWHAGHGRGRATFYERAVMPSDILTHSCTPGPWNACSGGAAFAGPSVSNAREGREGGDKGAGVRGIAGGGQDS